MKENESAFEPFPKIARLNRDCVITEKIDGTNAQVFVWDDNIARKEGEELTPRSGGIPYPSIPWLWTEDFVYIAAGSRNRWLTAGDDNFGFARWVSSNASELRKLRAGRHFGEWWGSGIQRGYGLTDRRFSLFNTGRWSLAAQGVVEFVKGKDGAPDTFHPGPQCCSVVPVLYSGLFHSGRIQHELEALRIGGSTAAPGFMNAEGIVIYHTAAKTNFKVTIKNDEKPKGGE